MSTTQSLISARSTKTEDAFQTIVSNRKSYKMLKGNAEAVWPPYLEEAMLKGEHCCLHFFLLELMSD
jgi:hypothetical protein